MLVAAGIGVTIGEKGMTIFALQKLPSVLAQRNSDVICAKKYKVNRKRKKSKYILII